MRAAAQEPVVAGTRRATLAAELAAAAEAIGRMSAGASLPDAIAQALRARRLPRDSRAPVQDIAYATARRLGTARALLSYLASRAPAPPVAALLEVALVQLLDPAPARAPAIVVDQAVAAIRSGRGGEGASGFANAVLRRFLRERDGLLATVSDAARAAGQDPDWPDWWVRQVRADHPDAWRGVLNAAAAQPPMTLRVDAGREDPDRYVESLAGAGIGARRVGPQAVRLDRPSPVEAVPGFAQGIVSVQDAGAQLAAPLLGLADGQRVLDACAAPGGKTVHLLELADIELVALDADADRLARVRENLDRCGFEVAGGAGRDPAPGTRCRRPVTLRAADAGRPDDWWDGRPFDRILLDAPCSASGIVRRHPDIRWLRRRGDLATLAATQRRLLDALWPLLAPGGRLLYVTCSLFTVENEAVVRAFVDATPGCQRLPLAWSFDGSAPEPVAQLLPLAGERRDHDGFFYALLGRSPG